MDTEPKFKAKIVSSPLRLLAFMIDAIFVLFFCRLALIALFLPEDWDLADEKVIWLAVLPAYLIGLILFWMRDLYQGSGLGKWFLNMRIAMLNNDLTVPDWKTLLKRNLPLLIMPAEVLFLIFNSHCRRLGDRFSGTVVIEKNKIEGIRFLTIRVIALFALVSVLWMSYIITAPIQVKKTGFYKTGKLFLENELKKANHNMLSDISFSEINRDENEIIVTFLVTTEEGERNYKVFIKKINHARYKVTKFDPIDIEG